MRRRHSILTIAFAASMLSGCLGSFGTPGEGTGTSTGTGTSSGTGSGTGAGDGTGNGAQSGGDGTPTPDPTPTPTPMPPAVMGGVGSKGMEFLLVVMPARSRAGCASLPVIPRE